MMQQLVTATDARRIRAAFTLVELMVSITIIAILAATVLFGMSGVQKTAKIQRTKSQIARIHEMIAEKWESYETRRVSFINPGVSGGTNPQLDRLIGLRELMRLEMPDRISDVDPSLALMPTLAPKSGISRPMLNVYYASRVTPTWTPQYQGAECLYLILSKIQIGDSNGLEFFSDREIGDADGDGMSEILDAWGNPIEFVRWAPGFTGPSSIQTGTTASGPDAMDLAAADLRNRDDFEQSNPGSTNDTFTIFPLIFSSGPNQENNITQDLQVGPNNTLVYRDTDQTTFNSEIPSAALAPAFVSDPYAVIPINGGMRIGGVTDDSNNAHIDNIYNHALDTTVN